MIRPRLLQPTTYDHSFLWQAQSFGHEFEIQRCPASWDHKVAPRVTSHVPIVQQKIR